LLLNLALKIQGAWAANTLCHNEAKFSRQDLLHGSG
jgi:hypothetical protein